MVLHTQSYPLLGVGQLLGCSVEASIFTVGWCNSKGSTTNLAVVQVDPLAVVRNHLSGLLVHGRAVHCAFLNGFLHLGHSAKNSARPTLADCGGSHSHTHLVNVDLPDLRSEGCQ